jgi:hypothetical protein
VCRIGHNDCNPIVISLYSQLGKAYHCCFDEAHVFLGPLPLQLPSISLPAPQNYARKIDSCSRSMDINVGCWYPTSCLEGTLHMSTCLFLLTFINVLFVIWCVFVTCQCYVLPRTMNVVRVIRLRLMVIDMRRSGLMMSRRAATGVFFELGLSRSDVCYSVIDLPYSFVRSHKSCAVVCVSFIT